MMAADYDAPRTTTTDDDTESIEAFKERAPQSAGLAADLDDGDSSGGFELGVADVDEAFDIVVLPIQDNEFTCSQCFLVRPRNQHDHDTALGAVCVDCAA